MNTSSIIRQIVFDAIVERDAFPLLGIIDHLIEQGYSKERIALFAMRSLHLEERTVLELMLEMGVTYIH